MAGKRVRTKASTAPVKAIHAVGQGRPRKNSANEYGDELITGAGVPDLFKEDPFASALWEQTVAVLAHRKVLKRTHLPVVMLYCQSCSNYFATNEDLLKRGLVAWTQDGMLKPAPATVKHQAFQQMVKSGSLLGLDPLSELRTGLIQKQEEKPVNGFAALDE